MSVLLDTLMQKETQYTPIWLMRQAGRYLPEYRQLREKAGSFMNLCTNPEWACEVTLQPLRRFNLDAAILFSDILVVPDAMGLGLHFVDGEGPKFKNPVLCIEDVDNLQVDGIVENLEYVFQAIRNIKGELAKHLPLIGFSGSPFTLACYMLRSSSSLNYVEVKDWLYNKPSQMHSLLSKITEAVIKYLNAQISAGIDIFMLFDSWGGVLSEDAYLEFSLFYIKKILSALNSTTMNKLRIPSIVFTKGGGGWLDHMKNIDSTALGIDWTVSLATTRKVIGEKILQGNLDPVVLAIGNKQAIKKEVLRIIQEYQLANNGLTSGHIFNLGHGVMPITNPDNVSYLVDIVHEISSLS